MTSMLTPAQEAQIESWIDQLNFKEKVSLLSGSDNWSTTAIPRLGIPSITVTDGPHGVRTDGPNTYRPDGPTTAYPSAIAIAATWDRDLVRALGAALAEETRDMGCDVLLGPCVNIIRTPLNGRNFETYSEDPYLAGEIGLNWVLGLQSKGVGASLKHFACNNQEVERMRVNVEVDERTLHEIYLPAFEKIVLHAQPWTVMCAYPRVNGFYCSENAYLLRTLLKQKWGFKGAVISDWYAVHSTAPSLANGLDLEMPGPSRWRGLLLQEAINTWQVEEKDIDDAVRRVLRLVVSCTRGKTAPNPEATDTPEHRAIARQIARESITLLKNEKGILPIRESVNNLAVIGLSAIQRSLGGGSSQVLGHYWVTPLAGLQEALGENCNIIYEPGVENRLEPTPIEAEFLGQPDGTSGLIGKLFTNPNFHGEPFIQNVSALNAWWGEMGPAKGKIDPHYFSAVWEGLYTAGASGETPLFLMNNGYSKLFLDDRLIVENNSGYVDPQYGNLAALQTGGTATLEAGRSYKLRIEMQFESKESAPILQVSHLPPFVPTDGHSRAIEAAKKADLVIVCVGNPQAYEREGMDRPSMRLTGKQDDLVSDVLAANSNTIIVVLAGGPVEMPWIDKAPAVVWAYFPGQEGGNALAEILTGKVNPSGKLPLSLPVSFEETPVFINYPGGRTVSYGEGIFIGYRYYDISGKEPLFAFGHGLSYSQFEYGDLEVPSTFNSGENLNISFAVKNLSDVPASEVAQVYIHDVQSSLQRPIAELKGFKRISLAPGEQTWVHVNLDFRSFSFYDPVHHAWTAEPGYFEIRVGSSSRDIRLRANTRLLE